MLSTEFSEECFRFEAAQRDAMPVVRIGLMMLRVGIVTEYTHRCSRRAEFQRARGWGACVLFGRVGQVQILDGRHQRPVAEVLLDDTEADVGFQQMRGEAVSQRVDRNFLAEVQLMRDLLDGRLRRGHARRGFGSAERSRAERVVASIGRKEKLFVPMRDPVSRASRAIEELRVWHEGVLLQREET